MHNADIRIAHPCPKVLPVVSVSEFDYVARLYIIERVLRSTKCPNQACNEKEDLKPASSFTLRGISRKNSRRFRYIICRVPSNFLFCHERNDWLRLGEKHASGGTPVLPIRQVPPLPCPPPARKLGGFRRISRHAEKGVRVTLLLRAETSKFRSCIRCLVGVREIERYGRRLHWDALVV